MRCRRRPRVVPLPARSRMNPVMAYLEARKSTSPWVDTTPATNSPPLEPGRHFDVAVLGGGMAGLTTAYLLEQQGASVAVIEADRVAAGVTAYTTAKVSSLHGTIYSTIERKFGAEGARVYGEANEAGKEGMGAPVEGVPGDCGWRREPALTPAPGPGG